jgi:general secretion pathway protein D
MNADYRLKKTELLVIAGLFLATLSGCGGAGSAFKRGNQAALTKDFETAMMEYKAALDRNPGNLEYQLKYEQARFNAAFQHFETGRRAVDKEDYPTAKAEFTRVLEIDPSHVMAEQQLGKVNNILNAKSRGTVEPEIQFDDLRQVTRTDPSVRNQLDSKLTTPISIHMNQDSRAAYESLAELAGLNVIFDPDFRGTRIPVDLNNVDIYDALDIISLQTRNFWKPINRTTILVSPDNQTKRRDYDDLVLKTVYMSNSVTSTEITEAVTALRTLLNMRYLATSTATNAILMRDTADRIAIAEKIIEDLDKAKPEVLVEVTVLEVDRSLLRQLGILPPQGTSVTFGSTTTTPSTTPGGTPTTTSNNSVSLSNLGNISNGNFFLTIPPTTAQFLAQNSKTKLVQNPQLRATDGKLASIRIGSQIPIASGSFQPAFVGATGTPVVNFQFVDVGVNLDITPRVLLNREINLQVTVQVRALAGDRNVGGVTQPVLTNRQVQHEIRLAEGETNILGGLITDTEQSSLDGIPGLKDIPIIRYFFSQEKKQRDQTEIIIMLTPHILRMPNLQEVNMRGLNTGSESTPRLRSPSSLGLGTQPAATAPAGAAPGPGAAAPPAAPAVQPAAPPVTPAPAPAANTPAPAAPQRTTNSTLSFSPSPVTLPPTGTSTVNIVGNGTDFYGVDLTLSFDPTAFNIREVREGGFLSRDGQIVAFVQRLETDTGMLRISLDRPPGAIPISGTGNLATLVIARGTKPGNSTLRITDFKIRDAQQNVATGRPAEVTISAP